MLNIIAEALMLVTGLGRPRVPARRQPEAARRG